MTGAVLLETLRQSWLQMFYWGAGLGLMGFATVLFVPEVDFLNQMVALLATLPPVLLAAVGIGDDLSFVATPAGFVAVGFFGKALLFMAAYPVVAGVRVTMGEEEEGTMDMLLSLPVPRWQVVLEKFVAYLLGIATLAVLVFVCVWLGAEIASVELDMGRLAETVISVTPILTFILAFTVLVGTLVRGRRLMLGIVTLFVLGSFMLDAVGAVVAEYGVDTLRNLSFFRYYDSLSVMQNGMVVEYALLFYGLALLLLLASVWRFQRRDIMV